MSSDVRSLRPSADDGFHEIQLSGKQLFFLFMATTVVSIVIFLCGVLVGRGARVEPAPAETEAVASPTAAPVTEGEPVIDSSAPSASPAAGQATQVESGDVDYYQTLTAEQAKDEVAQPPAEPEQTATAPEAAAATPPAAAAVTPPAATAAPAPAAARPAAQADTWAIQVAALKDRAEADRVAKRLQSRGYEAFVAEPAPGTVMFRVRVGRFTDRAEAERVKARLAREEKFKPWVTR